MRHAPRPGDVSILVVDDDPDLRQVLCLLLEDEGYPVHQAAHGTEALARSPRPHRRWSCST